MPIYEFKCQGCGKEFEALILGSRTQAKCPECGSDQAMKKMSVCAFKTSSGFTGTGKKAGSACSSCTSSSCSTCGG